MPKLSLKFPCRYRQEALSKICVYKIWADDKFLIWKGKSLTQSVAGVSETIHRALSSPTPPDHLFHKLMAQIEAKRCLFVEIDVFRYASDPLHMLQVEHMLLEQGSTNPNCLNISFMPYIPQWIPLDSLAEYKKWKLVTNRN